MGLSEEITYNPPPPPPAPGGTSVPLWSAGSYSNFPGVLLMQDDGNLVLYDTVGSAPAWSTGTWGHPGAALAIQNDGNLVIYDTSGAVLWASNTCCH